MPYNNIVARIVPAVLSAITISRIIGAYLVDPTQVIFLMSTATETISMVLLVIAYVPKDVAFTPKTAILSFIPSFFFLFCELTEGTQLTRPELVVGIMGIGLGLQIYAKFKLGRCYGILPANRGIVDDGPYRLVRHPIYLGYLVTHVGFMLGFFSWWNLVVLVMVYGLLALRILEEEKVLGQELAYRHYMGHVRYRAIPGVF
jgi:protein-S-isoprenylcysteine O-methyltransferase Ste14